MSKPPDWYGHTHLFLDHHSQALLFALGETEGEHAVLAVRAGRVSVSVEGSARAYARGEVGDDPNEVVVRAARGYVKYCRSLAGDDHYSQERRDLCAARADRIEAMIEEREGA